MKGIIAVDSSCALPDDFIANHRIVKIPHLLNQDSQTLIDTEFDEEARLALYQQQVLRQHRDSTITQPTVELIKKYVVDRGATQSDFIYGLSNAKSLTPIYDNFQTNAKTIADYTKDVRAAANIMEPLRMRIQHSGTVGAGHGALAAYAADLINQGARWNVLIQQVEQLIEHTQSLIAIPDIEYLQHRSNQLDVGKRGIGSIASRFAKFLDVTPVIIAVEDATTLKIQRNYDKTLSRLFRYTINRVREGLLTPHLVVSYAGDIDELNRLGYEELLETAKQAKIDVLSTVAPIPNVHAFGEKSLSIGFISKNKPYNL